MSDAHAHLLRYTVTLNERRWWGGRVVWTFTGTGSSLKANELLIGLQSGGFISLNYDHVLRVVAEPLGSTNV